MTVEIFYNPRVTPPDAEFLEFAQTNSLFAEHCLFQSSGTSGKPKWIALSRHALEASARAVNTWLDCTSRDVFGLAIPTFHVGGFGIVERARVVNGTLKKYQASWQPLDFTDWLSTERVTVASLVPTQIYDLVTRNIRAPKHLRAVVVGGGALAHGLYHGARKLNWPLLPSYGMTECASQIATARLSSARDSDSQFPRAHLLSHIVAHQIAPERVKVESKALLTCYVIKDGVWKTHDPKSDNTFVLPDKVALGANGAVQVAGRWEEAYKISGELIDYSALRNSFGELSFQLGLFNKVALAIFPDARRENCLALVCEKFESTEKELLREFNGIVAPFERISHFCESFLPRTELGKILISKINPVCLQEYSG